MAENRINGFVLPRSSANGRENTAKSTDVSKIRDQVRGVDDNEFGHKADLRKSPMRRETGNAEAESFAIEGPLHGQETSISGFRVGTRRKSAGQSLPKALLTPQFINTRRKSASELELKPDNRRRKSPQNSENLGPTSVPFTSWDDGDVWHERRDTSLNDYESDRVVQTMTFPAMSRVNLDADEEVKLLSSVRAHRKESKINLLKSGENATVSSERLMRFENNSTHRISLPDPGQGNLSWKRISDQELTRSRSFSDSEVEDSTRISAEQREKLEFLKRQILEKNLKGKDGRKGGGQQSTGLTGESRFPVLTEKSLKHYAKYHETGLAAASLSTINADQRISALLDVSSEQNRDSDIETARDKSDKSSNAEKTSSEFISLSYSENNPVKRKTNGSDILTPPNSEVGSFESLISIISVEGSRARSEPGDVATRKISTVQQLQNRSRSKTYQLNTKVQSFVKKPLPALPPSTLRVKKQTLGEMTSKAGHFKAGANANVTLERPRERKEDVINIHTCPNMNLFSDKSWMYQELSRKRHRYIRGPATPVPPVEFVFRKDEPDS